MSASSSSSSSPTRSDEIVWLEGEGGEEEEESPLQHVRLLRDSLERLRLSLIEQHGLVSSHSQTQLARYGRGARYVRHLDAFEGGATRQLTCLLYLNPLWLPEHGGALRLYRDSLAPPAEPAHVDVAPLAGRLLVFQSRRIEHQVLPVTGGEARFSLTVWFY